MAIVRVLDENRTLREKEEIADYLATIGIAYERWELPTAVADDASSEQILAIYREPIERLKQSGGYVTADVINVTAQTPNLEAMLAKFSREHWHDEDEVRFIIHGSGLFHIHPQNSPVVAIEVGPGDLIRVPRGTLHWFDLCSDRQIRAIRLFQDTAGWTPRYTDSRIDERFQPVCFGAAQRA